MSSLGRAESHVLANLDKVLRHPAPADGAAVGRPFARESLRASAAAANSSTGHTAALLGDPPPGRAVRIMVTLPSEAASDYGLVHQLVASGMDIARINCAHDEADDWEAMADARPPRRQGSRPAGPDTDGSRRGRSCAPARSPPGPAVLKLRPERDDLRPCRSHRPGSGCARVGSRRAGGGRGRPDRRRRGLARASRVGDTLSTVDARGAAAQPAGRRTASRRRPGRMRQTVYLRRETRLERCSAGQEPEARLPWRTCRARQGACILHRGDRLRVTREEQLADPAHRDAGASRRHADDRLHAARGLRAGARGRADLVRRRTHRRRDPRASTPRARWRSRSRMPATAARSWPADKGINLPDSQLDLPALTDEGHRGPGGRRASTPTWSACRSCSAPSDVRRAAAAPAGTRRRTARHRSQDRDAPRLREPARAAARGDGEHRRPGS